jgi:probable phosphoglycerate mutase
MIVLMRHAHTDSGKGLCIGRTPVSLSLKGKEQASEVAESLRDLIFSRLCVSPSARAMDTLSPLAATLGIKPAVVAALDEIDMGEWDGLSFSEIKEAYPEAYEARGSQFGNFRPPGGESFNDVADRSLAILSRLAREEQLIFAVTHAGVIRSVLCRVTGHPMDDLFHYSPGNVRCTVLTAKEGGLELVATDVAPSDLAAILTS